MEYKIEALALLTIKLFTFISKAYLLFRAWRSSREQIQNISSTKSITYSLWQLVCIVIFFEIYGDFSWIISLARETIFPSMNPYFRSFILRMAWSFSAIEYLCINIFVEKLINKSFQLSIRHKIFVFFSFIICSYLTITALIRYDNIDPNHRIDEFFIYNIVYYYILLSIVSTIYTSLKQSYQGNLPRILQHQSKIFALFLLIPHLILIVIIANPFTLIITKDFNIDHYFFVGLGNLLFTFTLYFCARRMLGLRFLNISEHVQLLDKFNFVDDFRITLEQLGSVETIQELEQVAKSFFQQAFKIKTEYTQLYIRNLSYYELEVEQDGPQDTFVVNPTIEKALVDDEAHRELSEYLIKTKILIKDELEFDYFYSEEAPKKAAIAFLAQANATIFIPLRENQAIVAYIIIQQDPLNHKLFSDVERDEMLIFTNYLGNIIYLLRHRNLKTIMEREKNLREDLYLKHQEINHYKESIRTLLQSNSTTNNIGIIHYKNKSLLWANKTALDLLQANSLKNLNPTYVAQLKQLALDMKKYSLDRQTTICDFNGNQLICSATPGIDHTHVVILIYSPNIADTFTIPFEALKDLSSWNYAIYLETTKSGQLINQLIPSSSTALLNFKIHLLQTALSKAPILIELPEHDAAAVVEIVHHISLRPTLHSISLDTFDEQNVCALELFGMEATFGDMQKKESLLKKLSDTGTIFIQNIEFLSLAAQNQLAMYLTSGVFQPIKSNRRFSSNARIICSTSTSLETLVEQGKFSSLLYEKLKRNVVSLPSLLTIPYHELSELAHQFSKQAIKNKELDSLIALNERETKRIIDQFPTSIHEFKEHVQSALINKSAKKKLDHLIEFNNAYLITDPQLSDAIKLGKHALKDKYIMTFLWNKFKNQAKIATLLHVNRSSVNRRCKEFNLLSDELKSV